MPLPTFRSVLSSLALTLLIAGSASAATYTNKLSGNWSAGGSWTVTPGAPSAGGAADAVVQFSPTGTDNSTNDLAGAFWLNQLVLVPNQAVTLYAPAGNTLLFTNTVGGVLPLLTNAGTSTLTINSAVILATNLTVGAATSGAIVINSNISESAVSALTKTGTNTLTLGTNNNFSGGLNILNGQTTLSSVNAAGTGTITLGDSSGANNATLFLAGSALTFPNNLTVAAGSSGTLTIASAAANNGGIIGGNVALNNNVTFNCGSGAKVIAFSGLTTVGSGAITINNVGQTKAQITGGLVLGGGGLTFNDNEASGTTVGAGNISGSGALTFNANSTGGFTVSAAGINHAGSITNSGSGTGTTTISGNLGGSVVNIVQNSATSILTLSGANTNSGALYINNGTVVATAVTRALGGNGLGTVYLGANSSSANATLGAGGITYTNPIVVALANTGTLTISNTGSSSLVLSGGITEQSPLTLFGSGTGSLKLTGAITGSSQLTVTNDGTTGYSNSVSLASASGNPSFTGSVAVGGNAYLKLSGSSAALGSATAVAVNDTALLGLDGSSGAPTGYTIGGLNGNSSTGLVQVKGNSHGVTLTLTGSGSYAFNGALTNDTGGQNLSLTLNSGFGAQTLGGTNYYSGPTTVTGGTLLINGSIGTNTVTVNAGATLGGKGVIGGATTLNAGAVLAPGANGVGTLTFNTNLALNAASTNNFVVTTGGGASNKVAVAGLLTANGSVIKITSGTALGAGTNTLFTYGTVSGSFNATPVFDVTPSGTASLVDDLAGHVNLVIASSGGTLPATGTNINFTITGGNTLNLSWPSNYVGWELQSNSVSLTVSNDWYLVPGSTTTNSVSLPVDPSASNVFYRMHHP